MSSRAADRSGLPPSPADRQAAIQRLEKVVRAHERKGAGGAPGFAVAVALGDDVLLSGAVGLASIEQQVAITPHTAFRIASVSKQFTCAAVLLLAHEGKLDIDTDIRDILPECLPGLTDLPRGKLSLRLLMHMASGLRDYLTMLRSGGVEIDQPLSPAQLRTMIARHTGLNFAPNTRFLYCNTNYLLLGEAVEKISGQKLADFLHRRLFAPLGMNNTRHTPNPDAVEPGLATAYLSASAEPRGGKWLRAQQRVALGGEGGLVSTLEDLLLWAAALRHPPAGLEFLPAELRRTLPFAHGHANIYARGQEVLRYRGLRTIGHGGLWPGYRTEFLLVPERDATVIVIANDSGINAHSLARRLLDTLLWPAGLAPLAEGPACPAPGLYFNADSGLTVEIGGPNPLHGDAPTLTLFSSLMPLRAEGAGWYEAEAGGIVLKVKSLGEETSAFTLIDDAGAGAVMKKIDRAAFLPAGLAGAWRCHELDAVWTIASAPQAGAAAETTLSVNGPVIASSEGWRVRPLQGDWVEIVAASRVFPSSFTARLSRNGPNARLSVQTARARGLVFERQ